MRSHNWRFGDLVVLSMVILLALAAVPALRGLANETADRVKCASNLRQIGQAILLYANENKNVYPRATSDIAHADKPVWGTPYAADASPGPVENADPFATDKSPVFKYRPAPNDVTAALFLLVRTQEITSDVFTCASTRKKSWDFGGKKNTAVDWTNFAGNDVIRDHLSYSYANPYPSKEAISNGYKLNSAISGEFVVAGDMNPGGDGPRLVNADSPQSEVRQANSANHKRDGQSFLYGDGHVEFQQTPLVGVNRDNVYTFGRDKNEGTVGSPVDGNDSVLLPTATDVGALDVQGKLVGMPEVKPVGPEESAKIVQQLVGQYINLMPESFAPAWLSFDEKSLTMGPRGRAKTGVTATYQVAGRSEEEIALRLSAPGRPPADESVQLSPDGNRLTMGNTTFLRVFTPTPDQAKVYSSWLVGEYRREARVGPDGRGWPMQDRLVENPQNESPDATLEITDQSIVMRDGATLTRADYRIIGRAEDLLVVELSSEAKVIERVSVNASVGRIVIRGGGSLMGAWTRN